MLKQKSYNKASSQVKALHKKRGVWFVVLFMGLLVIQLAYNVHLSGVPRVLGYVTDANSRLLLEQTNYERTQNGQTALAESVALTKAAQQKANDMVAKNYWNHASPDGKQPSTFVLDAGYNYQTMGENLAYGFDTAEEAVSGWMSSQAHKRNILGEYKDVGFGVAKSSNYQGGENTIIVAFYGMPAQSGLPLTQPASISTATAQVGGLTTITSGGATWATYASLGLIGAAAIGFVVTHLELLRLGFYRGRYFLKMHPLLDVAVVLALALLMVYAAGGFIG